MKHLVQIGSLMLLLSILYINPAKAQEAEPEWVLFEEQSGIRIYRAYTTCNEQPYALVKIENLNDSPISIRLKKKFIGLKEVLIDSGIESFFSIAASSFIKGSCDANLELSIAVSDYVPSAGDGIYDLLVYDIFIQ